VPIRRRWLAWALALLVANSCNTCWFLFGGEELPCADDDACPPGMYCDVFGLCEKVLCVNDSDCGVDGMVCENHDCQWADEDAGSDFDSGIGRDLPLFDR